MRENEEVNGEEVFFKCPIKNCECIFCTEYDLSLHLEFGTHTFERGRYQRNIKRERLPIKKPNRPERKGKIYRYF